MSTRPTGVPSLDFTAVIPAAGPVPAGVLTLSTLTSPAMVPVAGRPVIHWTIDYLLSLGIDRYLIGVPERDLFVESYVDAVFGADASIDFVVPSADRGPGFTVHELVQDVTTASTLVVLGDTFFRFADPNVMTSPEPFVVVSDVEESYRWCTAETDEQGVVTAFRDKVPGLCSPSRALIGAYAFPSTTTLREATASAVRATGEGPVSITAILEEVAKEASITAIDAESWVDCGNPDRQADAQRTLLQERAFNELTVDGTYGTITKRSRHAEKFLDEINYLRLLPSELEVLFPRLLSFRLDWRAPEATMEFYGYPTLTELFVFENIDPAIWNRMFRRLHDIVVDGLGRFERPIAPADSVEMLMGKVLRRRDQIDGPPALVRLLRDAEVMTVNGVEMKTLRSLEGELTVEIERLADTAHGSVIHGDLCFSNILFDPRSGIFKLIDPRGSYGRAGIYGDLRYDVAKLCHSVVGLYDFITADLFRLEVRGDEATLDIRSRHDHDLIRRQFEQIFFASFDRRDILLITGMIFLGLPSLHFDEPDRQLAFCLRGMQLLHEALATTPGSTPP